MPGSSFDDVLLVNPSQLHPATPDEVARAESELGVRMPSGYAAYMQQLGKGALGAFVRVYAPTELLVRTLDWRERIQEYWFWDTTDAGVAPESLQERGVVVADSFDGDELCFDPTEPETLFVLPRDEEIAYRVGPGFLAAVDWMLSGVLNPWVEGWTFEAWGNRVEVRGKIGSGHQLSDAARAVAELDEHAHLVDLGHRKTFFLPAIGARLSLYQFEGQDLEMDLTYDGAADPAVVNRIVSATGGLQPVATRSLTRVGERDVDTLPQELVGFGDRYLFPADERYPEQTLTLSATPGPPLAMRYGAVAIADPWNAENAPKYPVGAVHDGEQATVLTTIARTRPGSGELESMAVAASVGNLDQVVTWQPALEHERHFHLDVDSGLGAFYEITDTALLQPLFEDDLYMQGINDRAQTEPFVSMEVDGRVAAAVFLCPNGSGLYPAWEGYDKGGSGVAVLVDLKKLGGAVRRVG